MTNPIDEDLLRAALHDAVRDVDPTRGAEDRVLAAALPQVATESDELDAADDLAAVVAPRRRRVLLPLTAAAAVLVLTALVVSLTAFHGPTGQGQAAATLGVDRQRVAGIAAPPTGAQFGAPQDKGLTQQGSNTGFSTYAAATGQANNLYLPSDTNGKTAVSANNGTTPAVGTAPAKVVAVGTITMKVPTSKLPTVLAAFTSLAQQDGGYVASSKVNAGSNVATSTATIVLRVPQHKFGSLVTDVQRYGTPTSVVTNSSDVTGEFVDYEARIAALEASRTQYLAILSRASSISDILAVQSQINDIQSQIEQLKGARNVLVNEAAYSTLTISLNGGPGSTSSRVSGLATAWDDSIGGFVKGFEWVVRAAGPALFALLCVLVLLVVGRFGWRTARRRML